MGGGLNHLSLLLEFTLINQNNRNTLSLAHGTDGCRQSLDWTGGLDCWTGLVDWTSGLDWY